jgi:hypothetical protein
MELSHLHLSPDLYLNFQTLFIMSEIKLLTTFTKSVPSSPINQLISPIVWDTNLGAILFFPNSKHPINESIVNTPNRSQHHVFPESLPQAS